MAIPISLSSEQRQTEAARLDRHERQLRTAWDNDHQQLQTQVNQQLAALHATECDAASLQAQRREIIAQARSILGQHFDRYHYALTEVKSQRLYLACPGINSLKSSYYRTELKRLWQAGLITHVRITWTISSPEQSIAHYDDHHNRQHLLADEWGRLRLIPEVSLCQTITLDQNAPEPGFSNPYHQPPHHCQHPDLLATSPTAWTDISAARLLDMVRSLEAGGYSVEFFSKAA